MAGTLRRSVPTRAADLGQCNLPLAFGQRRKCRRARWTVPMSGTATARRLSRRPYWSRCSKAVLPKWSPWFCLSCTARVAVASRSKRSLLRQPWPSKPHPDGQIDLVSSQRVCIACNRSWKPSLELRRASRQLQTISRRPWGITSGRCRHSLILSLLGHCTAIQNAQRQSGEAQEDGTRSECEEARRCAKVKTSPVSFHEPRPRRLDLQTS